VRIWRDFKNRNGVIRYINARIIYYTRTICHGQICRSESVMAQFEGSHPLNMPEIITLLWVILESYMLRRRHSWHCLWGSARDGGGLVSRHNQQSLLRSKSDTGSWQ